MQITQSVQRLKLFDIQRTCVYDGPGIRTTIFFQGCNLRCAWCQNPEGQPFRGDKVSDQTYSIDDIMEIILRDRAYYSSSNGGVTLSGGEPLLQDPGNLTRLLEMLKERELNVSVETSLHAPWKNIKKIAPYVDLFIVDLKVVGDDDLHEKFTKFKSTLIHENIEKLVGLDANIKFRMVMVPGYNDSESNIQATSEYLKSIHHDTIELLKYHNLYEDKAKRLGLEIESLEITAEQSLASLERGLEMFKALGIKAYNTEIDSLVHKTEFTPRVKKIQRDIRTSPRALCFESSKLKTKYYKKHGFEKPTPIHRAERLSFVLQKKKVKIYPGELLVGNFNAKRVAGQPWEEHFGILDVTFLYKINRQKPVPFECSLKDRLSFYFNIFPFWMKHSVISKAFPKISDFVIGISRAAEMNAGFNNNLAAIAHFIVNFEQILEKGTSGLIKEIKEIRKGKPKRNQAFYTGTIIALEALEAFANRYADKLTDLSKKEKDPARKEELAEMAAICQHVPKYPARTFHEALQSMMFLHIALCIESYENAVSFGRLDQILYPYYRRDKEAGRITYEEARELLCLFILKMDESILVNDGNSFLSLNKLFETLSTDQSLTFGGVGRDGKDATNEVTYMLVDACELQPLAVDMSARIHESNPDKYVNRLAEVYISGCPTPKLYSDAIYIDSILKHYPVTPEQARNYSIVGCVEPNASDDHFGNTDCANVNLPMPFLQALKGHDQDLWNHEFSHHLEILVVKFIKHIFRGKGPISRFIRRICDALLTRRRIKQGLFRYNPPSSMEELLDRFQLRLNRITQSILKDHQTIERVLRKDFTTPLTSSLFRGCLESGKDVNEGGTTLNSSGIQAVGVTDVADSLHAINELVFKKRLYTIMDIIHAIDSNFKGKRNQRIRDDLLAVPKFGDDSSKESIEWINKVLEIYNNALDSVENCPRGGRYSAGYYALNVCTRYGKETQALPSGRLEGVPLANSITPHYGMEEKDLLSSLNSLSGVDFTEHAENGTTATLTIDSALFQGTGGITNLASIFKTFLTTGGMQLQPNVISRETLLDAYEHPEKHRYLMVRIAGYCAYFYELSDELKKIIINRTCYS
ncbi:MAG: pyruvate formate lyase family protein [Promethearchaeota archaeon]